jgi:hypothetical protein
MYLKTMLVLSLLLIGQIPLKGSGAQWDLIVECYSYVQTTYRAFYTDTRRRIYSWAECGGHNRHALCRTRSSIHTAPYGNVGVRSVTSLNIQGVSVGWPIFETQPLDARQWPGWRCSHRICEWNFCTCDTWHFLHEGYQESWGYAETTPGSCQRVSLDDARKLIGKAFSVSQTIDLYELDWQWTRSENHVGQITIHGYGTFQSISGGVIGYGAWGFFQGVRGIDSTMIPIAYARAVVVCTSAPVDTVCGVPPPPSPVP